MPTLRILAAIIAVAAAGTVQAQILAVNVIDRHSSEMIEPDSLRIEIPSRSIDTVITTGRFTDWDPTVSVWEGASQGAEYSWDGNTISGSGFEPYSQVSILLCDVLGRTIEQLTVTSFYNGSFRTVPATSPPALTFIRVTDGYRVVAGRLELSRRSQKRTAASPHRDSRIADAEQIYVTAYRHAYFTRRDSISYDADSLLEMTIGLQDSLPANDAQWIHASVHAMGGCGDQYSQEPQMVTGTVSFGFRLENRGNCSKTPEGLDVGGEDDQGSICGSPDDPEWFSISIYVTEHFQIDDVDIGSRRMSIQAQGYPEIDASTPWSIKLTFRASTCTGSYSFHEDASEHTGGTIIRTCDVKELVNEDDYIVAYLSLY